MTAIANHLWQSTLFAAVIAMLCYVLRGYAARTRYWLWLAASLKFLVPLAAFVWLGTRAENPRPAPLASAVAVEQISVSFAPVPLLAAPPGVRPVWPPMMMIVWAAGCLFVLVRWLVRWHRLRAMARAAGELPMAQPLPVLSTPSVLEPGLFGIFRPVLLLPEGLRLSEQQFAAILTHELCHFRYRDNLTAALHMVVEALCWFHPLVWWIGARLVEERERACDEAVLATGNDRAVYADGIVTVCRHYVASPLACAAGVSGADLRQRITAIMTGRVPFALTATGKALLAAFFVATLALPVALGVLRAQTGVEYKFEVASIRPAAPGQRGTHINTGPAQMRTRNTSVFTLITFAYSVQTYQVSGGPAWARDERYDITANHESTEANVKTADLSGNDSRNARISARLRNLLADRFALKLREETKEQPVFGLVFDRGGHKLKAAPNGAGNLNLNQNNGTGGLTGDGVTLKRLAIALSQTLGRPVIDETGSNELFALDLKWSDGQNPEGGASLFTALREQLGLRLEAKKGPVTTYVIEHVEKPSEN